MKYFITFVGILFLMAGSVFCMDLTPLSFYTEPALFPFNAVVGVAEDSQDCLYFATRSGLIKYNGITSEKYEHIPFDNTTIRSSQIQTIYMDTDDILWLGTYSGLERFDIKTETISHFPISDDVITAIFRDSKQHLWVGTINGLYFCRDGSCKTFTLLIITDTTLLSEIIPFGRSVKTLAALFMLQRMTEYGNTMNRRNLLSRAASFLKGAQEKTGLCIILLKTLTAFIGFPSGASGLFALRPARIAMRYIRCRMHGYIRSIIILLPMSISRQGRGAAVCTLSIKEQKK